MDRPFEKGDTVYRKVEAEEDLINCGSYTVIKIEKDELTIRGKDEKVKVVRSYELLHKDEFDALIKKRNDDFNIDNL
jgi:hypothetical protein